MPLRASPLNPRSQTPDAALKRRADALWGKIILKMYGGVCAACGNKATDPHHVIRRECIWHRWHPHNGIALCRTCHTLLHDNKMDAAMMRRMESDEIARRAMARAALVDSNEPGPVMFAHELKALVEDLSKTAKSLGA